MSRSCCAAFALLLWSAACAPGSSAEAPGAKARAEAAPATFDELVFEGYRQGSLEVEVRAASAEVDPVARVARLRDVKISFADARRGAIVIRAEAARYDMQSDDFVLEGRVEGQTGEGERFEARDVRYDAKREKLRSDEPVRVYRENLTLTGDGMEIDVATRRVKIEGRVRTVVTPQ